MKIAVVNLEQVVSQSRQGKELQRSLQAFQRETQRNVLGLVGDLHELRNRLANSRNMLSKEQLASLRQEFEKSQQALQRFKDEKQREGKLLREQGADSIKQKLPPILNSLLNERTYDVILNAKTVLVAARGVDITDTVAARFSQTVTYPRSESSPPRFAKLVNRKSNSNVNVAETEFELEPC